MDLSSQLTKRKRSSTNSSLGKTSKRHKRSPSLQVDSKTDYLTPLSDELLIRIITLLPLETVLVIQQVSHRFQLLSRDSQIWKNLYYIHFILPRAVRGARVGISKEGMEERTERVLASRKRWLIEEKLLEWERCAGRGGRTDWKARYRLRFNWCRGRAEIRKIDIAESNSEHQQVDTVEKKTIVRMIGGVAITASNTTGLQAWDLKSKERCIGACLATAKLDIEPTSLALDIGSSASNVHIVIGLVDGNFELWTLSLGIDNSEALFVKVWHHRPGNGQSAALTAVAYSNPYVLGISADQLLSVFILEQYEHVDLKSNSSSMHASDNVPDKTFKPRLLSSLKSHTSWPPLSLSIRSTPSAVVASVAYSIPTYSGWTVGLQELHLSSTTGEVLLSRLASALNTGFHSLLSAPSVQSSSPADIASINDNGVDLETAIPSSLSYSHPYLLAGHCDNTLTLYMVRSDQGTLSISRGTRLWGHTSGILCTMVGLRGKAVSVGAGFDEIRVWDLEGGRRGRGAEDGGSVCIKSSGRHELAEDGQREARGWIGFDEEVVVVKDRGVNEEAILLIYDFT